MVSVKCTYSNGDITCTRFNGTFQEAEEYFLNQVFNLGVTEDRMVRCVKVEEIPAANPGGKEGHDAK